MKSLTIAGQRTFLRNHVGQLVSIDFLLCQPFSCACCMSLLSAHMIVDAFFISQSIRRPYGRHSNLSRRFRMTAHRGTWFEIATESAASISDRELKAVRRYGSHRKARGRIATQNELSVASDANA